MCEVKYMSRVIELTGEKFGKLTVIERAGTRRKRAMWKCECECGITTIVAGQDLKSGNTKSCGCVGKEKIKNLRYKHGLSHTRIHNIWWALYQRCCDENSSSYHWYGAKGITMCEDWKEFNNFHKWCYENGYNENFSIDRKNNNIGYYPDNCRWVDMKTQQRNRGNNRFITIGGITKKLCEWSEESGLHHVTILSRIKRGVPEDKWLSINPIPRRDSKKTSGVKYVYWHNASEKWMAMPNINGKSNYLGLFDTVEEASKAIEKIKT